MTGRTLLATVVVVAATSVASVSAWDYFGAGGPSLTQDGLFQELDRDGDGSLSESEFAAAVKQYAGHRGGRRGGCGRGQHEQDHRRGPDHNRPHSHDDDANSLQRPYRPEAESDPESDPEAIAPPNDAA